MNEKAYQHMLAWTVQTIYNTNKEGMEILANNDLTEDQKLEGLKGIHGTDYRLLNLFLLLKPAFEDAKQEFPEQTMFFEWFEDRWKLIEESNMIQGKCGCKGCRE